MREFYFLLVNNYVRIIDKKTESIRYERKSYPQLVAIHGPCNNRQAVMFCDQYLGLICDFVRTVTHFINHWANYNVLLMSVLRLIVTIWMLNARF